MPHATGADVVQGGTGEPSTGLPLDTLAGLSAGLRGPVFAIAATGLGAGGHVLAGGLLPGLGQLGLATVGVGLVFSVVARREQSLLRLVAWLGGMQLILHAWFSIGSHHHHMAGPRAASSGQLMLVAHALAAALVAWWLRRGEAAVWRLARRFFRCCRLLVAWVPPAGRPRRISRARLVPARPQCLVVLGADPRRGPPLFA